MDSLWRDLHFAFRTLRKSPAYTAVALATLALGIGANSAIFSVVKGVVLNPLPFTDSDELVRVWEVSKSGFVMQSAWRNFVWQNWSSLHGRRPFCAVDERPRRARVRSR